ncbi:MAG: vanadium-dependent haloperoxidase [Flavobacteriales bacterium]|nr:vanadium-dependent haloperoxidase [Flavobacteriales bacterium]
MKTFQTLVAIPILTVAASLSSCGDPSTKPAAAKETLVQEPRGRDNMGYYWGSVILEGTANDTERNKPRPPVNSRMVAMPCIAMYDAWSRFDSVAVPFYLKAERKPVGEQTLKNKEAAIAYATVRILEVIYPADSALFAQRLQESGFDPTNRGTDPATAAGIGNLAAQAVLEARKNDGSNQYGDHPDAPSPYGDYTKYACTNTADMCKNIDRWAPKYFTKTTGERWAPGALAPHWGHVDPFLLDSANQFRSPPPPVMGDEKLEKELREVVELQANLTNEQKALVEFMRDGPRSVQQAGHWLIFARDVSIRDQHTLDQEVKMYLMVTATAMDCFIACWDTKYFYDNSRPYQQIHHLLGEEDIVAWAGPNKGMQKMKGKDWRPYSPDDFLCPPFPAYVSGHSTVSGGCARALELFTGSDEYGVKVKLLPGWLTEPGITTDSVTLDLATFSGTANMAGRSRVLGGYHIETDNVEGLAMGRKVAEVVVAKCNAHINGTAAKDGLAAR